VLHGLAPVWSPRARLLVLGSFPSVASLQAQQYYAHPRNQFWPILSALWGKHLAHQLASPLHTLPYAERVAIALAHGVAIWDVYAQCVRPGSLDSAIRDAQLNDLPGLIARSQDLRVLAHNGGESARHRRITERLGHTVLTLPSTSPANASWSFERKLAAWRAAFEAAEVLKPLDSPPGR
jgi:hypoxanthine-DNA glycosylase